MSKIQAVLIDLDGTIRDSKSVVYAAVENALMKHTGKVPSREELLPYIHHHEDVHKAFAEHVEPEEFMASYWAKVEELRPTMKPYEGANELIAELKSAGYRLAIVTSAVSAPKYLASYGVADSFDVIIGGNDTAEHKPHPAPVLKALKLLKVSPEHVVMIGDLPADIESAKAAKVANTISITHGFGTRAMLEAAGSDYIIDSFSEVLNTLKKIEAK